MNNIIKGCSSLIFPPDFSKCNISENLKITEILNISNSSTSIDINLFNQSSISSEAITTSNRSDNNNDYLPLQNYESYSNYNNNINNIFENYQGNNNSDEQYEHFYE